MYITNKIIVSPNWLEIWVLFVKLKLTKKFGGKIKYVRMQYAR